MEFPIRASGSDQRVGRDTLVVRCSRCSRGSRCRRMDDDDDDGRRRRRRRLLGNALMASAHFEAVELLSVDHPVIVGVNLFERLVMKRLDEFIPVDHPVVVLVNEVEAESRKGRWWRRGSQVVQNRSQWKKCADGVDFLLQDAVLAKERTRWSAAPPCPSICRSVAPAEGPVLALVEYAMTSLVPRVGAEGARGSRRRVGASSQRIRFREA